MHACIHTHKHTYITLHCIALHCIALHYIALHCIALRCVALHCIALHTCIHTYRHTYIHTYTHTHIHTYTHTHIQTYTHTHIHTYTHTHIHTYTHTDIQTDIHTYIWHAHTHTPNICVCTHISIQYAPVVPARGGAEVALGIYYKTFLIYRTCMRRAPARPVRAFFFWSCCAAVQEHGLCATPVQ